MGAAAMTSMCTGQPSPPRDASILVTPSKAIGESNLGDDVRALQIEELFDAVEAAMRNLTYAHGQMLQHLRSFPRAWEGDATFQAHVATLRQEIINELNSDADEILKPPMERARIRLPAEEPIANGANQNGTLSCPELFPNEQEAAEKEMPVQVGGSSLHASARPYTTNLQHATDEDGGCVKAVSKEERVKELENVDRVIRRMERMSARMSTRIAPEETHVWWRRWARRITDEELFYRVMLILIFVNTVITGVECDFRVHSGEHDIPAIFDVLNIIFVIIFMGELTLQLLAVGCHTFFRGEEWSWNILEFVITLSSVVDLCVDVTARIIAESESGQNTNLSHMKVLRLLRLARVLRSFRVILMVKHFNSLRSLIHSVVNSVRSVSWTLFLLFMIFYLWGVALTQLVSDHCRFEAIEATGDRNALPACSDAALGHYWSGLFTSMLTLFMAITGGISYEAALQPMKEVGWVAVSLFVFYIVVCVFAVLNVVTAVFCHEAIDSASNDRELAAVTQLAQKNALTHALETVFRDIDDNSSGRITPLELRTAMHDDITHAFMEAVGISVTDVPLLFSILDTDSDGAISIEEFVTGCMDLKGPAKAFHFTKVTREQKKLQKTMDCVEDLVHRLADAAGVAWATPTD